jgi:hypothetical protein
MRLSISTITAATTTSTNSGRGHPLVGGEDLDLAPYLSFREDLLSEGE